MRGHTGEVGEGTGRVSLLRDGGVVLAGEGVLAQRADAAEAVVVEVIVEGRELGEVAGDGIQLGMRIEGEAVQGRVAKEAGMFCMLGEAIDDELKGEEVKEVETEDAEEARREEVRLEGDLVKEVEERAAEEAGVSRMMGEGMEVEEEGEQMEEAVEA